MEARDELAGRIQEVLASVEQPDRVTRGYRGSLVAWKGYGRGRHLAVIYKELTPSDGFVITAFFTTKPGKGRRIWP